MKSRFQLAIVMVLFMPGVFLEAKTKKLHEAPDAQPLVTAISMKNKSEGKITIFGEDTPFVVKASTTISIDGHPATLGEVHKGMQVLSHTMADSSAPEIDLKTAQP